MYAYVCVRCQMGKKGIWLLPYMYVQVYIIAYMCAHRHIWEKNSIPESVR